LVDFLLRELFIADNPFIETKLKIILLRRKSFVWKKLYVYFVELNSKSLNFFVNFQNVRLEKIVLFVLVQINA